MMIDNSELKKIPVSKRFGYVSDFCKEDIEGQKEALKEDVSEIFEDVNSADRPQLQKLLSKLKSGDVVLVFRLASLSPDYKECMILSRQIESTGAKLYDYDSFEVSGESLQYDFQDSNLGFRRLDNGNYWCIDKSTASSFEVSDIEYFKGLDHKIITKAFARV